MWDRTIWDFFSSGFHVERLPLLDCELFGIWYAPNTDLEKVVLISGNGSSCEKGMLSYQYSKGIIRIESEKKNDSSESVC